MFYNIWMFGWILIEVKILECSINLKNTPFDYLPDVDTTHKYKTIEN